MKQLQETSLFKHFQSNATSEQITLIESNAKRAADRLSLVRDTFPTYTLHNEQHVLNIIGLMGEILDDRMEDLHTLEAAILILSAYYHDIGMVFTEEERSSIQNEIDFSKFIEKYPKAQLMIFEHQEEDANNKNTIPNDVAEWYCRWVHPDRSADFVNKKTELLWGIHPINDAVAFVCKSHGYSISEVHGWRGIDTDFLGEADLFFCSIILRLADILDFDNSRSPEEVYNYLKLAKPKNARDAVSNTEWKKHLCATGFTFKSTNRNERYPIRFIAAPKEPAVEYDIREFLNIIENEFDKCNAVLEYCSEKWRNFYLPLTINKDDIRSQGYTYGAFRFTLEQDQILNLLMGENLYSDPYDFIRELVQNAIDTTRHREVYEKSKGNSNYTHKPIVFSSWIDQDGYTWLRIDDYGMGMDEYIIRNFFLKVGQSYYQSDSFKVEQTKFKTGANIDFMPISRFGIGILSCFIVGDRIELNTRRVVAAPERNAIRMTMNGLNSFFVLQKESERHTCLSMPNKFDKKESYRAMNDFGTSISIRLDAKKDKADFDLKKILNKYVVVSPVKIFYDDELVGGNYQKVLEEPWGTVIEYTIDEEDQTEIERVLDVKFSEPLKVIAYPLDLTRHSPSLNFKGQGLLLHLKIPKEQLNLFNRKVYDKGGILRKIQIKTYLDKKVDIEFSIEKKYELYPYTTSSISINHILADIRNNQPQIDLHWLSHNGIYTSDSINLLDRIKLKTENPDSALIYNLALKDSLRPDVSIARDQLRGLNWRINSVIHYTFSKAISNLNLTEINVTGLYVNKSNYLFRELEKDPLIHPTKYWAKENIFTVYGIIYSLSGIRKYYKINKINLNSPVSYDNLHDPSFIELCRAALIQVGLNVLFEHTTEKIIIIDEQIPLIESYQKYYPPLFFIQYNTEIILRKRYNPINSKHPFSKWLIKNTETLNSKYPGIFKRIRTLILRRHGKYTLNKKELKITIQETNKILQRLRDLKYEDIPSKTIFLKESDFEY